MTDAIATHGLVKYYGRRRGLDGLDLQVRPGEIYGFLGPNGAGKTTTIRILLDLIRPTSGAAEVLGQVPSTGGAALRRRLGYLPGDFVVDGGQTSRELLTHLGHLRGGVARERIEHLAERLELDLGTRIRSLSKGNRQKVGVIQAFMHEPELLILDEPTAGLDPLLQQTFLEMAREARAAGQTVFMSSHVLSEVQQSADRVGIIRDGLMVAVEAVDDLRLRAVRRVEIHFDDPVPLETFANLGGVSDAVLEGSVLRCRLTGRADALIKAAARWGVESMLIEEPDLEELFFSYYADTAADGPSHAA
ncbi:MAG TPA: ABC transporter ATP-binding protein [Candidatus Limnocylindrales bacterium]|nr:ABC transporter ATP-binding protein [Candidatus Limnocylindrales bacterium]